MNINSVVTVISLVGIPLAFIFWLVPRESIIGILKNHNISNYIEKLNLRTDFRIAIIDDEIIGYPIQYIKDLGFAVKEYELVSFADSETLVKNDLLLLDVKGVVKEDLDEGGAKLIKIIKEERPLLPIVAVSSGYFHAELNDYFKISDATVNKPIDEFKIRELLNELKREFFDAEFIGEAIENSIKSLDISNFKKKRINKAVIDFLSKKSNENYFLNIIHENAKSESQLIIGNSKILLDRIIND
jgi:hypothetical protein